MGTRVVVHTDDSALKHLLQNKDTKQRLIRWVLLLEEFNLEIKDKKSFENVVADLLSRLVHKENEANSWPIQESFSNDQLF